MHPHGNNSMKHVMNNRSHRAPKNSEGAGMVELLIALLLIGSALTGSMSLYTALSKDSKNNYYRAQSQFLMIDLANRIRASGSNGSINSYVMAATATPTFSANQSDLQSWYNLLQSYIPGAQFSVARSGNNVAGVPRYVDIQIIWNERRDAEESDVVGGFLTDTTDPRLGEITWQYTALVCSDYHDRTPGALNDQFPSCEEA